MSLSISPAFIGAEHVCFDLSWLVPINIRRIKVKLVIK